MVPEAAAVGADGRAICASSVVDKAIRADRPPPHGPCLRGFQGKRAAFFSAGLCVSARNLVPASIGWHFKRYDEGSSGRHLHLVAVLCPEVHLLQFRFRRSPSRIGKPLPRRTVKRNFIAHLAMDAGHSLPGRRDSQWDANGPPRSLAERLAQPLA